jgi:geranylgeranyl reductase family protein
MMLPSEWDLLVIGAGPAGSSAAAEAASRGLRTLVVDAKTRLGEQPHCGEFVPRLLLNDVHLGEGTVVQPVSGMVTVLIDQDLWSSDQTIDRFAHRDAQGAANQPGPMHGRPLNTTTTPSPGFLIDRVRLDRNLARRAVAAGAVVFSGARLTDYDGVGWNIALQGRSVRVQPRYVIAADGAMSRAASCCGLTPPQTLAGLQAEVPLRSPLDHTYVFLNRKFLHGYGWLFPKQTVANVGVGVASGDGITPRRSLTLLTEWLLSRDLIGPGRLALSGGLIPVSGLRERLVMDNVLFCGDAAGLTHPITGAGIPQALRSGRAAGRAAALASQTDSQEPLHEYEADIRGTYGGILEHARSKRDLMTRRWDHTRFVSLCESTWVAYKGYRRRVRAEPGHTLASDEE